MKIKKFEFYIGSYFGPKHSLEYKKGLFEYRTIQGHYIDVDDIKLRPPTPSEIKNGEVFRNINYENEDLEIPQKRLERFCKYLKRYCKSWEKEYFDHNMRDGLEWECNIRVDDLKLKSYGHVNYPSNFDTFIHKLCVLTGGKIFG